MENAEENNTYYYKLNNEWHSLNIGQIELAGLSPGNYKIYVSNQPKDNAINDFITIIIRPPFYKTWWFLAICLLGIGTILFAFFKVRTNSIRKQTLLQKTYEQKLAESEMQTLRSQMNPHFMFNTLNSINSYIIQNKTALASEYLTTFSKLMRSILDLSKQETVPLSKEIDALKMYIELEALRLENKFDYSISMDKNVDDDATKIPSLIIQPFVENAIWHGLHNKKTHGHIDIKVKETEDHNLLITIEDDGIGRKAASEIKHEYTNHKSYGISITINRVKLLNNKNEVIFTDLYDSNNNAAGTKVTIHLYTPLNTIYND
jgi:sensor histidine kinase YesM